MTLQWRSKEGETLKLGVQVSSLRQVGECGRGQVVRRARGVRNRRTRRLAGIPGACGEDQGAHCTRRGVTKGGGGEPTNFTPESGSKA